MHVYQSRVYTYIDSFHTHTLPVSHTFQTSLSSSMPPDSDNIDLVNPLTFKKEEGIGKKHTYSPALLFYVIKACDKALEIPKHEISRIPPPSLTVGDLMRKVIPRVESGWPLYKAETWFSRHISIRNGDLPCFGQRGTPCAQREIFLGFFCTLRTCPDKYTHFLGPSAESRQNCPKLADFCPDKTSYLLG